MSIESSPRRRVLDRFVCCCAGVTAIEYALIAGGVGVAIAAAVVSLGTEGLTPLYQNVLDHLVAAVN